MNSPAPFTLKTAFEDDSLLIVDKPQGLAATPGRRPSLCEQVFAAYPALAMVRGYKPGEGGLLNRLDNETGGLVLFAKSDRAFEYYTAQMRAEQIVKYYTAVVARKPPAGSGIISAPIAHHAKSKKRMVVVDAGNASIGQSTRGLRYRGKPQTAVTRWKLAGIHEHGFVLDVLITKGVRHQIRVHLAYAGMPIAGDKLYRLPGNTSESHITCHLLYARGVRFKTCSGKTIDIEVSIPFLIR
jgi:23S rRNA pseudouridine1911/1915/1917 synthase